MFSYAFQILKWEKLRDAKESACFLITISTFYVFHLNDVKKIQFRWLTMKHLIYKNQNLLLFKRDV